MLQESVQLGNVEPDYFPDLQYVQNCTWKKMSSSTWVKKKTPTQQKPPILMVLGSLG